MDNNGSDSNKALDAISGQLGIRPLTLVPPIESDETDSQNASASDYDHEGATDTQGKSRNPIIQLAVASAAALALIGIPLSLFFGIGGSPQATQQAQDAAKTQTTPTVDPELQKAKTDLALNVQGSQSASPSPSPTQSTTPKPSATPSAPAAKATPPTQVKPSPPPVVQQPRAPIQPVIRPSPTPTPRVIVKAQTTPPMSWEQASDAGQYGGSDNVNNAQSKSPAPTTRTKAFPTLPLPVGVSVFARTITPFSLIAGRNNTGGEKTLSVSLDQQINLSGRYILPIGTVIQFATVVADNGAVTAISKDVYVNRSRIAISPGVFTLASSNNEIVMAKQISVRQDDLASADNGAAFWGAVGSTGKALLNAGNQSSINSSAFGSTTIQTNNPNPNYVGAALDGAATPYAQAKLARANALSSEINGLSKMYAIAPQTRVRVYVSSPGNVQISSGK